jgi:DNA-binding transcriptional MerR regulator
MDEDLISKKELLDLTGISYGQLYRWKRKNLIPEDWFIRKSTFTGQETFFPRDKILDRIEKIKHMKDDLSLDELANMFSPHLMDTALNQEELLSRNIVSSISIQQYMKHRGNPGVFTFDHILFMYLLDQLLKNGEVSLDEGKLLLQVLGDHFSTFQGRECELIFIRKMGIPLFLLVSVPNELYFDSDTRVITRLSISTCIEELKVKLQA